MIPTTLFDKIPECFFVSSGQADRQCSQVSFFRAPRGTQFRSDERGIPGGALYGEVSATACRRISLLNVTIASCGTHPPGFFLHFCTVS